MQRPVGPDPAVVALQAQIAELKAQLEDDEPDEDEQYELKMKKLARDVRRDGMSALFAYLKDQGAEELVDQLPAIKEMLRNTAPALMQGLLGAIKGQLNSLANPPPPSPPPVAAPPAYFQPPPRAQVPSAGPRPPRRAPPKPRAAPPAGPSVPEPAPEAPAEEGGGRAVVE
jgi:hypothetical protein